MSTGDVLPVTIFASDNSQWYGPLVKDLSANNSKVNIFYQYPPILSTKWTKCTGESEACISAHLSPLRCKSIYTTYMHICIYACNEYTIYIQWTLHSVVSRVVIGTLHTFFSQFITKCSLLSILCIVHSMLSIVYGVWFIYTTLCKVHCSQCIIYPAPCPYSWTLFLPNLLYPLH